MLSVSARWILFIVPALLACVAPQPEAEAYKPEILQRVDSHGDLLPRGAQTRLGTIRFRTDRKITRVGLSPDGKHAVTAQEGEPGLVWDLATGKVVRHLKFLYAAKALTFSPNGRLLGANGVFDVHTGKGLHHIPGSSPVFIDDDRLLASTYSPFGQTHLFSIKAGKTLREFPGAFVGLARDAKTVTTRISRPGEERTVVWDLATGKELHELRVPIRPTQYEGRLLLSQRPSDMLLHDIVSGRERPLERSRLARFYDDQAAFSPDGTLLAGSDEEFISVWDTKTGAVRYRLPLDGPPLVQLRFSPDGKFLAAAYPGERSVRVWTAATGKLVHEQVIGNALDFSADGTTFITADGQAVRRWETATGKELQPRSGGNSTVQDLVYSPDGRHLAVTGRMGPVVLWNVATGKVLRRFPHRDSGTSPVAFSPDGKRLAYGDGKTLVVAATDTGKQLLRLDGFQVPVQFVALSPDGAAVAGAGSLARVHNRFGDPEQPPEVRVFDLMTGKELAKAAGEKGRHDVVGLAFTSPKDVLALAANDMGIYDLRMRKTIVALPKKFTAAIETTFSHDAALLAVSGIAAEIQVIDLASNKVVNKLSKAAVGRLRFSRDSRFLSAIGWVGGQAFRLYEWDLGNGKEVARFPVMAAPTVMTYSPDGRSLATGSADTSVLLWSIMKNP